jgi:hypothetical protein
MPVAKRQHIRDAIVGAVFEIQETVFDGEYGMEHKFPTNEVGEGDVAIAATAISQIREDSCSIGKSKGFECYHWGSHYVKKHSWVGKSNLKS